MATEFRLPELGENVESGDVLKVLVAVGDTIAQDQPVLELETDKATIEVPSPLAGTVKVVHVKEGEKLKVGGLILTVEEGATPAETKAPPKIEAKRAEEVSAKAKEPIVVTEAKAAAAAPPKIEKKVEKAPEVPPEPTRALPPAAGIEITPRAPAPAAATSPREAAPASPSVRRLARELGVDINEVEGSGPGGRISEEDVKAYVRATATRPKGPAPAMAAPVVPLPDFTRWGEIERKPMRAVRRKTAEHLSYAWSTIPHVTHSDKADITELEQLRKRYESKAEAGGAKLTVTAIAVKVVAEALKMFPQFASSIDMAREELIYKMYCHIGVAVDTDRGLLVPVLRDADKKNIWEISSELAQLAEKARSRKIALEEMEGGVFTISNLGGIGGTHFSPIVNWPEVAILGIARTRMEPMFIQGMFQPRLMLPLSLSYDHRIIDGADAARFLRWVAEALEQPSLLLEA
jgi:pyruvate dehydrogenase E2 component (dihydrolipoamide acetyltransferase)